MHLTTSFLILWSCWGLTMEEPQATPYTFLYSDVDACTRYNFLPINEKNFREAVLFFNLCQQLLRVLPPEQRKDYARYLRHELMMTRNEFKSKNDNKDIAQWLDKKIDSLLLELNKQQPEIGNGHMPESVGPQLPQGRGHHWTRLSIKGTGPPGHSMRSSVSPGKSQDYEDMDQDDLLAEERISLNDAALIGLILGLVSTVSAALTLMYICYCGNKRKKKKALCKKSSHRKEEKEDNEEDQSDQQLLRPAVESQMSTKIAAYASGECKVNKSEACVMQYQPSLDPKCSDRSEEQCVQKTNMLVDYGETNDELRPEYEELHETLLWNTSGIPEVEAPAYPMNMEEIQVVNNTISQHTNEYNELGYTINERKFSNSFIKDQRKSECKIMPTFEMNQGTEYKEGFGDSDEQKNNRNAFVQPKASVRGLNEKTMDIRDSQNLNFVREDAKSGLPLTYTQQKYSKGQLPLMDSHFPCDVQRQPRLYAQQTAKSLQPTQEQPVLQKDLEVAPPETKETLCMNAQTPQVSTGNLNTGGNQEIGKCKNCNKRISTKKRLNFTCENETAMMRSKLVSSKTSSTLDKKTSPACTMTESENVMRQEKFLCSLSATTPLTMKEPYFKIESKAADRQEMMEDSCRNNRSAENTNLQIKDDLCGDAQGSLNKSVIASTDIHLTDTEMRKIAEHQRQLYKSLQNPANKKHHRQKVGYPKSPLAINATCKTPQNKPVHENNSSYYSVKPGSSYQSCAEVNNPVSTKEYGVPEGIQQTANVDGIHKANDTFTAKTQKKIKTVFSRYNRGIRESDEEKLINR